MAFPWLFSEGFESGTDGLFDAEVDTGSKLTFPHYSDLARAGLAPYRGAFALRVVNSGTADAFVREDTGFDFAAADRRFVRWYFYLAPDFTMADTDKFAMFNLESVLDTTVEVAAGIDRSGANIRFWVAETNASAAQTMVLGTLTAPGTGTSALGRWYHAELNMLIDSGAGNDGTIAGFIDDAPVGSTITALDQGVSVDAKFGVIGPEAGTTGTLLIDDIVLDDAQIFRDRERFPMNRWVVQADDHPLVGSGKFSIAVTGTGTDAVLSLYDSDGVPNRLEPIAVLRNLTANEFVPGHDIFEVHHGLYTTLSGTAAQAFLSITRGGAVSQAALVSRGLRNGGPKP